MSSPSNFKKDLAFGQQAEAIFHEKYPNLTRTDGRKGDFVLSDGRILELKNDRYSPHKWPNVVIERYSYAEKPGGPWQSAGHGASIYAYNFFNHDLLLLYPVAELCAEVERLVELHGIDLEERINLRHVTRYYRIDRNLLSHLLLSEEILK